MNIDILIIPETAADDSFPIRNILIYDFTIPYSSDSDSKRVARQLRVREDIIYYLLATEKNGLLTVLIMLIIKSTISTHIVKSTKSTSFLLITRKWL